MKILFSGGGTAGHVNPAVAIADAIRLRSNTAELAFVGREGGDEYSLVEKRGYKLYRLQAEGLSRKNPIKAAKSLAVSAGSLVRARKIIKDFSPELVVGTGGYVSTPVLLAAHLMKIPTLIHESNVYPGLTTRLLSRFTDKILLNFDGARRYLRPSDKIRTVGNPLLNDFSSISRAVARRRLGIGRGEFLILSFGGSGGSFVLNSTICEFMHAFSAKTPEIKHIHAVGKKYYADIRSREGAFCRGKSGCKILPYIDDMPTYMRGADLVISRAGAMTLSEIAAVGAPSILIPSPNVSDDHQTKNAETLTQIGAAALISESELSLRTLMDKACEIYQDKRLREGMSRAVAKQYNPRALDDTLAEIYSLIK